uniref:hypothetical protein n=1 Tax=Yersinia intermedia TaxID=631 RepID=UPI001C973E5B
VVMFKRRLCALLLLVSFGICDLDLVCGIAQYVIFVFLGECWPPRQQNDVFLAGSRQVALRKSAWF